MLSFFTSRLHRYRLLRRIYADFPELQTLPNTVQEDDHVHLNAAIDWLMRAHEATLNKGVAASYNLQTHQWGNAYRETTGYIIPSLLLVSDINHRPDLIEAARKMTEWELSEQQEDGAFGEIQRDGGMSKKIFNTGQVLLGLCDVTRRYNDPRTLNAAKRAADWLILQQEPNGSWDRYTTQGPRTYHIGVAWPLLEIFHLTHDDRYLRSAEKSIDWVLEQQTENGWFKNTSLSHPDHPWTHLIAYTIRGLLECSRLLPEESPRKNTCHVAAQTATNAIVTTYFKARTSAFPFLPGTLDANWNEREPYTCLTGDAQLAIICLKLNNEHPDPKLSECAHLLIDDLKKTQILNSSHAEINGGILGSYPLYGSYVAYNLLNWATKFFIDALVLKHHPDLSLRA